MANKRILDVVDSPADLKLLTDDELSILAREIREQIITTTSKTGGHVASSLARKTSSSSTWGTSRTRTSS